MNCMLIGDDGEEVVDKVFPNGILINNDFTV